MATPGAPPGFGWRPDGAGHGEWWPPGGGGHGGHGGQGTGQATGHRTGQGWWAPEGGAGGAGGPDAGWAAHAAGAWGAPGAGLPGAGQPVPAGGPPPAGRARPTPPSREASPATSGDGGPAPGDRPGLPRGRVRVSKACDNCNRRRRRCSAELPACARCVERGLECVYTDSGKKRGPPPSAPRDGDGAKRRKKAVPAVPAVAAGPAGGQSALEREPWGAQQPAPVGGAQLLPFVAGLYSGQQPGHQDGFPPAGRTPAAHQHPAYPFNETALPMGSMTSAGLASAGLAAAATLSFAAHLRAGGGIPFTAPADPRQAFSPTAPFGPSATLGGGLAAFDGPSPPRLPATPPLDGNDPDVSFLGPGSGTAARVAMVPAAARSPNMAISALLSDYFDPLPSRPASRGASVSTAFSAHADDLAFSPFTLAGAASASGDLPAAPASDLTLAPPLLTPHFAPSLFADLPPLPPPSTVAEIFAHYLERVNPLLDYPLHPPTFSPPPPLLLYALLAYTCPFLPVSTPRARQSLSLLFFRRAQRLLQPVLGQLRSRRPTPDEEAAVLVMALAAGTAAQSSVLSYKLGGFLASCVGAWGVGDPDGGRETPAGERALAAAEEGGEVPPGTVLRRERRRRVVWMLLRSECYGAAAVPDPDMFPGGLGEDAVRGFLLPCAGDLFARAGTAGEVVAGLDWTGGEVLDGTGAGAQGDTRYWRARMYVLLGRIVDFHKFCLEAHTDPFTPLPATHPLLPTIRARVSGFHASLAEFPAALPAPGPTPAGIWLRVMYHLAHVVLHSPRRGAAMDPSVLLGHATWLASPSFGIAAGHARSAAELLSRLDAADPEREHSDPAHMGWAQMVGVLCYVRASVALRRGEHGEARDAAEGLARARGHQALVGRRWRMAAQMAVFLEKLEEALAAQAPGDGGEVPVVWTREGLLLGGDRHVMLWDDAVDFGQGPGDDGALDSVGAPHEAGDGGADGGPGGAEGSPGASGGSAWTPVGGR